MMTSDICIRDQWSSIRKDALRTPLVPLRTGVGLSHRTVSLGCMELWRDFPVVLGAATNREVIAYDRLGFGRSYARTGRFPLDFVREEAAEFFPVVCAQLGVREFVAMGHSIGSGMSIQCAAEFAGRCEALVTIAA